MGKEHEVRRLDSTLAVGFVSHVDHSLRIAVSPGVITKLGKLLARKNLRLKEATAGVFVVVVAATGVGVVTAKVVERKRDERPILTKEQLHRFEHLVDTHYKTIVNYVKRRTHVDNQTAEFLAQEIFLRAYRNFGNFKRDPRIENPEKSWLMTIAHNRVKNYYRDSARELRRDVVELDRLDAADERPSGILFNFLNVLRDRDLTSPELLKMRRAIGKLPDLNKFVLYLKHTEDLSNKDIGWILGRTEGAVKSLYLRSLAKLRKEMKKMK